MRVYNKNPSTAEIHDSPIIASLPDAKDKASRFHGVSAFDLPDNNSTQALLGLKDKSFSQARMKP